MLVSVSRVALLHRLHVVGRVQSHPAILATLAPALLVLVLEFLELLASFEGKFVRFSSLVVVESPDGLTRLAVICQHVLAVIFVKLLVIKRIGILRTVAETFKQLAI